VTLNQDGNTEKSRSASGLTIAGSRPDTLVIASNCTFLIGEDKKSSLGLAWQDLIKKACPLPSLFYGEVQFILGYAAAGTNF